MAMAMIMVMLIYLPNSLLHGVRLSFTFKTGKFGALCLQVSVVSAFWKNAYTSNNEREQANLILMKKKKLTKGRAMSERKKKKKIDPTIILGFASGGGGGGGAAAAAALLLVSIPRDASTHATFKFESPVSNMRMARTYVIFHTPYKYNIMHMIISTKRLINKLLHSNSWLAVTLIYAPIIPALVAVVARPLRKIAPKDVIERRRTYIVSLC